MTRRKIERIRNDHDRHHEQRLDMIVTHAWETWTNNGLGLDGYDRAQTTKSVYDAAANTYLDDMSDEEWLKATFGVAVMTATIDATPDILRKIQADQAAMRDTLDDVKARQVANETMMAAVLKALGGLQEQMAALNGRMDRFDERMRRIETRLGLTDEQP